MGFPKCHFQCGPVIDFLPHSNHFKIEGSNATIDPNLRSSAGANSDTDPAAPGEVTDDIVTEDIVTDDIVTVQTDTCKTQSQTKNSDKPYSNVLRDARGLRHRHQTGE